MSRNALSWTWNRRFLHGTRWSRAVKRSFSSILIARYVTAELELWNGQITPKQTKNSYWQVGRVDRALVRNLIVGYVTADQAKRPEILRWVNIRFDVEALCSLLNKPPFRIVATVLDFSQEERGNKIFVIQLSCWEQPTCSTSLLIFVFR